MTEGKLALGNHLHMECVWFVFSDFLQLELDKVKDERDMHFIMHFEYGFASSCLYLVTVKFSSLPGTLTTAF